MRAKCNAAQTNFIKEDFVKSQPNWKILILYLNNALKWDAVLIPAFPFMSYFFQFHKAKCFFPPPNQRRHFKEHNGRHGQGVADETKHLLHEALVRRLTSLLWTWNRKQQQSAVLFDIIDSGIQHHFHLKAPRKWKKKNCNEQMILWHWGRKWWGGGGMGGFV